MHVKTLCDINWDHKSRISRVQTLRISYIIKDVFIYLFICVFERETTGRQEDERGPSTCWFTPQMITKARSVPSQNHEPGVRDPCALTLFCCTVRHISRKLDCKRSIQDPDQHPDINVSITGGVLTRCATMPAHPFR